MNFSFEFGFIPKNFILLLFSESEDDKLRCLQLINVRFPVVINRDFDVSRFLGLLKDCLTFRNDRKFEVVKISVEIVSKLIVRIGPELAENYIRSIIACIGSLLTNCGFPKNVAQMYRSIFRDLIVTTASPQKCFDELIIQTDKVSPAHRSQILICFAELFKENLITSKFLMKYLNFIAYFTKIPNQIIQERVQFLNEVLMEKDYMIYEALNGQKVKVAPIELSSPILTKLNHTQPLIPINSNASLDSTVLLSPSSVSSNMSHKPPTLPGSSFIKKFIRYMPSSSNSENDPNPRLRDSFETKSLSEISTQMHYPYIQKTNANIYRPSIIRPNVNPRARSNLVRFTFGP